jgi:hypothetical protein
MSATETSAPDKAVPKHNRRKRASVGGFKTRLDAPQKKGMTMRWVNDEPGRIPAMHELGYDFAEAETRTDGQGTRISRIVGTHPSGEPKMAYLMETPNDQYAIGAAEKEERLKPFEEAINRGEDTTGKVQDAYAPKLTRSTINNTSG